MKLHQYYNLVLQNAVDFMNTSILLVVILFEIIFNDKSYGTTFLLKTFIVIKIMTYTPKIYISFLRNTFNISCENCIHNTITAMS